MEINLVCKYLILQINQMVLKLLIGKILLKMMMLYDIGDNILME